MWGSGTGVLAFAPTYAQWGYYLRWNATTQQMDDAGRFKFPSCPLGRQVTSRPATAAAPKYAAADSSDARSAAHSKHLECAAPNITEPFDTYTAARPNAFWALGERTSLWCSGSRPVRKVRREGEQCQWT